MANQVANHVPQVVILALGQQRADGGQELRWPDAARLAIVQELREAVQRHWRKSEEIRRRERVYTLRFARRHRERAYRSSSA